jgi:hypothetical protein
MMEKARIPRSHFRYVLEHIANGDCIFFLGAGAGVGKTPQRTLPTGKALVRDLVSDLSITNADYLPLPTVSHYYEIINDRPTLDDFLRSKLNSRDIRTPETYEAIVDIIEHQRDSNPSPLVITTNYDLFLERELDSRNIRYNVFIQDRSERIDELWRPEQDTEVTLYKFHGCLDKVESIVITDEDYIEFLCGIFGESKIPYYFKDLVQSKSLIFLGYSLLDWDFRVFFKSVEEQRKSNKKKHFAVLLKPTELSDDVWLACKEFWLKKEVRIIEYDALNFLNEIKRELGVVAHE